MAHARDGATGDATAGGALLIVEDDADVLRAARIVLSGQFERIESARDCTALEELMHRCSYDVALLDMNFVAGERTGRDGLDALVRLRAADPDLAIVLMTAYGGVQLAVEALKRGATDFVLKPWHNDKLVAAVAAAARATRERRAADRLNLDALERDAIERALSRHRGNISLAAATLGLSRPALYRRLAKYGLQA
jgi:DNA-binding NtrC family response regulator